MRGAAFRIVRAVGAVLPLPVLMAVLWPLAFARAIVDVSLRTNRRPPLTLPPATDRDRASRFAAVRQQTAAWLNTASLVWADRFTTQQWTNRLDVEALENLRPLLAQRPVIVVTLHFGGIFVLPSLLRANRIPTASVVAAKLWPIRWWRKHRAELTQIDGLPTHFESGDARGLMHFLRPGHCLLVAADYPLGNQAPASFESGQIRLSTPPLRLARLANAAVVPVLVRADGIWRYSLKVGRPVPEAIIQSSNFAAGVAHIANELLPIAAARPEQALPLLVAAFRPEVAQPVASS